MIPFDWMINNKYPFMVFTFLLFIFRVCAGMSEYVSVSVCWVEWVCEWVCLFDIGISFQSGMNKIWEEKTESIEGSGLQFSRMPAKQHKAIFRIKELFKGRYTYI